MTKSKLIHFIPIFSLVEGVFLMIYGFATGASFLEVVFAFIDTNPPLTLKEFYVLLGLIRVMFSSQTKPNSNRGTKIVYGILLSFFSVSGIVFALLDGATTPVMYGVFIEFIVMFPLSLFYLIHAFRLPKEWWQ